MGSGGATAAAGERLAGPSQLPGENGAVPDGGTHVCPVCGRQYTNPRSLEYHKKMHAGLTTCVLCGKVSSKVEHLRRHLENVHKLSQEDIRSIVPTRNRARYPDGV
ncbi:transcriptional repressor scratch 1-like [Pollicipes pollicipes]|uniref:transcriptional repressor scratch 1-like n=1 Tax=Pollicipes pollicipes TaxID=41117 RepID=UPI0018850FF4|nr:transcriptional repressor scratch 1-like [Pollicipes pollicipes]